MSLTTGTAGWLTPEEGKQEHSSSTVGKGKKEGGRSWGVEVGFVRAGGASAALVARVVLARLSRGLDMAG